MSDGGGRQTHPPLFEGDHCRKQFLGVFHVGNQIHVGENNLFSLEGFDLSNNVLNGTGDNTLAKCGRISAEGAGVITAAHRFYGIEGYVFFLVEQVLAW